MQGAASCQALLAGEEPALGGCHKSSRTRQSFHPGFRTDPKVFLPGLSEEFPPPLTPLICFIFPPLCLPGFQLEAKVRARGGQPIPAMSPTHIGAPREVQKSPRVFGVGWLEWAPNVPNTLPQSGGVPAEPREYPVPLVGDGLVLALLIRHQIGWKEPLQSWGSPICI